jgi:hypothetical protein
MSTSTLQNAGRTRPQGLGRLLQAGVLAAAVAAAGNLLAYVAARALLASDLAIPLGGSAVEPLPAAAVVIASAAPALLAALFLWLLQRYASRPLAVFYGVSAALLLLSFGAPLSLPVAIGTRLTLVLMHVLAGAAIVGVLGWAVSGLPSATD